MKSDESLDEGQQFSYAFIMFSSGLQSSVYIHLLPPILKQVVFGEESQSIARRVTVARQSNPAPAAS